MIKDNVNLDFRNKKWMKKEKYLLGQVKDNDLISEKHKKESKALNYFEHFLAFVSANSGSV